MNDHEREERETEDIKRMLEAGDERCMKLLFDKFYRALCMYVLRYPVSPEVAEDIVQTVFISLWTNKRGKPFEGSLRSYLFGAVSKAALCWVRDHGKVYFEDIESHIDDFWDDVFSQEDAEQEERLRKKLHAAVDALPEKPQTSRRRNGHLRQHRENLLRPRPPSPPQVPRLKSLIALGVVEKAKK